LRAVKGVRWGEMGEVEERQGEQLDMDVNLEIENLNIQMRMRMREDIFAAAYLIYHMQFVHFWSDLSGYDTVRT
jgi:hypothetical protein